MSKTKTPQIPGVTAVVERAVREGRVPGALVEVRADGELAHRGAHGVLDDETGHPLRHDTVLWLASLSKPVGTAALLQLADEGRLGLDDPVSRYVPEFAAPGRVRVLRPGSPSPPALPFGPPPDPLPEFDVVPAERELTLFDLVTHTGGLQGLLTWNPEFVPPAHGQALAEYVPSLGGLVRDFQPGSSWAYSNMASFDVLARVVEVAAGDELDKVLRSRLFEPLGMTTTGFGRAGEETAMPLIPPFRDDPVVQGTTFRSTSGGLWSTAEDYLRFAELLRAGGVHAGHRLLSEESIARMTTNRTGSLCPGLNGREPAPGIGFGLSVAVIDDPAAAGEFLPAGSFGWDGVSSRRFWVSPTGWSLFLYAPDPAVQREIEDAVTTALA
ncbi:serine hydrolase domain-containing protein [Streptomyces sp. BH105]|uniref:serine hydrolase domain-containing protein n=1 Tax=Streptomyces sp. BH105 TaxID=3410408 RepID=UPI003CF58E84